MELDKDKLLNIYDSIEDKRKERDSYIEMVAKLEKQIEIEKLEYRINSVHRILSFIHSNLNNKDAIDFDVLITHCCNKLAGNIDGTEIDLKLLGV